MYYIKNKIYEGKKYVKNKIIEREAKHIFECFSI
jgi:hypothetical protein